MEILVVDDEPIVMEGIAQTVRTAVPDADVRVFQDPQEALSYAQTHPVDVAFLDVEMPGMSGLTLAMDMKKAHRRVNIIFITAYRQYAVDAMQSRGIHASGYLMKPVTVDQVRWELKDLRYPTREGRDLLNVQTFGNFEVTFLGEPVRFEYSKTKELLAYLVDRRGAMCTNGEIQCILWEGEGDLDRQNNYLKQIRKDLRDSLQRLGCEDVIVQQRGRIGVRPDRIRCDYYLYRDHRDNAPMYCGEYMAQYSWAEVTHAWLEQNAGQI